VDFSNVECCHLSVKRLGPQDPYEILDIPRDATENQIRKAYRRLAKRFPPDRNRGKPDTEKRFKQGQDLLF